MKIRQQLYINESLDPFTLLKVCQALSEMPRGEALELICKGGQMPNELFKVFSLEEYDIVKQELSDNPEHCQVVIKKRKAASPGPDHSEGGCCCS